MSYGNAHARLPFILLLLMSPAAMAQDRGIMVREAVIYIAPDKTSEKLGTIGRGRELVVIEKTQPPWLHVFASVTGERDITGWIVDKGVVRKAMPNGARIIYGEAADSEAQASRRGGRKGAAQDAMRLYARVPEYFPDSPLAGEALYRAADVRWQLEKDEVMSRPSAKERDPDLRAQIPEEWMRQVMRKYQRTKWADLAAFHLIDNKLCGDWRGSSKCPEKETELYEKYAGEHPQSPRAPEALYEAAWRQSTLIEIYKSENQAQKSARARTRGIALAQRVVNEYPQQGDWAVRAQRLIYFMEQNIPTYGNVAE